MAARWGVPEEPAGAVVFLASGERITLTAGATTAVDGGWLAH